MVNWPGLGRLQGWLKQRAQRRETATDLYGGVVAQAREAAFYAEMGVPDTLEGRYEMIALHLALVLDRLRVEGARGVALSRETIETFIADMDGSMREMGVGDLTVPKKVKSAAAGLYARADAFRQAMAREAAVLPRTGSAPHDLDDAIARFTLSSEAGDARAAALARYYRGAAAALAKTSTADVLAGRMAFPYPATERQGGMV